VKQILVMPGYNQCVLVQHGEYFTFYCKLKKVDVKSGQTVKTGAPIGTIDDSEEGNAILHFQLWKGTDKQNPETWLRK
jgi:septal ring factor EnvC (AmiA/AmiB activator)